MDARPAPYPGSLLLQLNQPMDPQRQQRQQQQQQQQQAAAARSHALAPRCPGGCSAVLIMGCLAALLLTGCPGALRPVEARAPDRTQLPSTLVEGYLVWSLRPKQVRPWTSHFTKYISPPLHDMIDMVTPKGYPLDRHDFVTTDGYKIVNFRIPYGRSGEPLATSQPRPPVLLIHGITLSSTSWVVNEPHESLAFILADHGYDVWMLNTRGNTFSREHVKYHDKQHRYWEFSADEMALIDLPAAIDYICGVTGYKSMGFVGHSQGGTFPLMLGSLVPVYNKRISVNVPLSLAAHAKFVESPVLAILFGAMNVTARLPPQEYLLISPPLSRLINGGLCQLPHFIPACILLTESCVGVSTHITTLQYRKFWKQWPSSTSYWNVLGWAQEFTDPVPRFTMFDYGPDYDLSKVAIPTVLISGGRDVLAPPKDVERSRRQLKKAGCLVGDITLSDFAHMDFIWSTDDRGARVRVYPRILEAFKKFPPLPGKI